MTDWLLLVIDLGLLWRILRLERWQRDVSRLGA